MVQISDDLKVISIPLSTDIANPHIHKKYLNSKSITTNSTRLKADKSNNIKLILDTNKDEEGGNNDDGEDSNDENIVLEGSIATDTFTIRWGDGSSWQKQGVNVEEEEERQTPSITESTDNKPANYNKDYESEISSLKSQLSIISEKEKMAKSQSQATMVR